MKPFNSTLQDSVTKIASGAISSLLSLSPKSDTQG